MNNKETSYQLFKFVEVSGPRINGEIPDPLTVNLANWSLSIQRSKYNNLFTPWQ